MVPFLIRTMTPQLVFFFCKCLSFSLSVVLLLVDVDEYALDKDGCQDICFNTDGSYVCSCNSGYSLHSNVHDCIGKSDIHGMEARFATQPILKPSGQFEAGVSASKWAGLIHDQGKVITRFELG